MPHLSHTGLCMRCQDKKGNFLDPWRQGMSEKKGGKGKVHLQAGPALETAMTTGRARLGSALNSNRTGGRQRRVGIQRSEMVDGGTRGTPDTIQHAGRRAGIQDATIIGNHACSSTVSLVRLLSVLPALITSPLPGEWAMQVPPCLCQTERL